MRLRTRIAVKGWARTRAPRVTPSQEAGRNPSAVPTYEPPMMMKERARAAKVAFVQNRRMRRATRVRSHASATIPRRMREL